MLSMESGINVLIFDQYTLEQLQILRNCFPFEGNYMKEITEISPFCIKIRVKTLKARARPLELASITDITDAMSGWDLETLPRSQD
jgi:hypothetical protein